MEKLNILYESAKEVDKFVYEYKKVTFIQDFGKFKKGNMYYAIQINFETLSIFEYDTTIDGFVFSQKFEIIATNG
jgi:hypothetical protein